MSQRTVLLSTVVGLAVLMSAPSVAVAVEETTCGLALTDAEGVTAFNTVQGLSVISLTAQPGPFHLTQAEGEKITAVQCLRSELVPAENDDKVVLAGYPLFISTERDDRSTTTIVLEVAKGLFQVREVKGKLKPDEITQIGAKLDVFNDRLAQAGTTQ
jgi:hypothetical protein